MKTYAIVIVAAFFCSAAAPARSDTAVTANKAPGCCGSAPAGQAAASAPVADALAGRPDAWRYRWHNGYWWYYTPQNTWLYYSNNAWQSHPQPVVVYSPPRSYRSNSMQKQVDSSHSLGTVGNYPRYWLWQRLGN